MTHHVEKKGKTEPTKETEPKKQKRYGKREVPINERGIGGLLPFSLVRKRSPKQATKAE